MKRALLLAVAIVAPSVVGATPLEDVAVLRAVLDRQCRDTSGGYYVLVAETHALSDFEAGGLPRHTRAVKDLLSRNKASSPLPEIGDCPGIRMAAESEVAAALAEHPKDANPIHVGWEGFYAHFPNARGVRYLSFPGYSRDRRTAVVVSGGAAGALIGSGFMITLKKTGNEWKIVESRSLWIS